MPFITNDSFVELVKGKTVALVGPAASASQIEQGDLIESYDFVARVKSLYVPEHMRKIYGKRTDFLYTSDTNVNDVLPGSKVVDNGTKRAIYASPEAIALEKKVLRNELIAVCSTYPAEEWFFHRLVDGLNRLAVDCNVRIMSAMPYMEIRKKTNRPNSGFSAIIDLASLPFSEIYITGVDFYRSLYRGDYLNSLYTKETIRSWSDHHDGITPDGTPDRHDPDAQFVYFKHNMYNVDSRIKVDHVLEKYLNDPFYEKFENCLGE